MIGQTVTCHIESHRVPVDSGVRQGAGSGGGACSDSCKISSHPKGGKVLQRMDGRMVANHTFSFSFRIAVVETSSWCAALKIPQYCLLKKKKKDEERKKEKV